LVVISSACRLVLMLMRYWWNWCNVEGVLGARLVVHGLLALFVALGFALGAYLGRGCIFNLCSTSMRLWYFCGNAKSYLLVLLIYVPFWCYFEAFAWTRNLALNCKNDLLTFVSVFFFFAISVMELLWLHWLWKGKFT
jgi:hypothetical protein